jgi:hypothetical protein
LRLHFPRFTHKFEHELNGADQTSAPPTISVTASTSASSMHTSNGRENDDDEDKEEVIVDDHY